MGGLPVAQRADGFLMNETQPMGRYIARISGFYPTDPLECFWCDKYAYVYDPIINTVLKYLLTFDKGKKQAAYDELLVKIEECLKVCNDAFREGKFMIGDGSKIMMCDFFLGRTYTDHIANPKAFII